MNNPINAKMDNPTDKLPTWLNHFISTYQQLSIDNLTSLDDIYHPQIVFIDPIHHIQGLEPLKNYFEHLAVLSMVIRFIKRKVAGSSAG